jgi:hypothetical protein
MPAKIGSEIIEGKYDLPEGSTGMNSPQEFGTRDGIPTRCHPLNIDPLCIYSPDTAI